MKAKKDATVTLTGIKSGRGTAGNSSLWKAAYCREFDVYSAVLHFCSGSGSWSTVHIITKEAYDSAGSFADDDYKTERMLREGKKIYRYDNDSSYPEPLELVLDKRYGKLCAAMLELP